MIIDEVLKEKEKIIKLKETIKKIEECYTKITHFNYNLCELFNRMFLNISNERITLCKASDDGNTLVIGKKGLGILSWRKARYGLGDYYIVETVFKNLEVINQRLIELKKDKFAHIITIFEKYKELFNKRNISETEFPFEKEVYIPEDDEIIKKVKTEKLRISGEVVLTESMESHYLKVSRIGDYMVIQPFYDEVYAICNEQLKKYMIIVNELEAKVGDLKQELAPYLLLEAI